MSLPLGHRREREHWKGEAEIGVAGTGAGGKGIGWIVKRYLGGGGGLGTFADSNCWAKEIG